MKVEAVAMRLCGSILKAALLGIMHSVSCLFLGPSPAVGVHQGPLLNSWCPRLLWKSGFPSWIYLPHLSQHSTPMQKHMRKGPIIFRYGN